MAAKKKAKGQIFTPESIVEFMINLSTLEDSDKDAPILEPAAGTGRFVKALEKRGYSNIVGFEIDEDLSRECKTEFRYEDFLFADVPERFRLAIGNPPYIRRQNMDEELKRIMDRFVKEKKIVNTLSDFSYPFFIRSIELLEDGGELMFITPSYWLTTLHGTKMRQFMQENGHIRLIVRFNETQVFGSEASFDPLIFSFVKGGNRSDIEIIDVTKGDFVEEVLEDIITLRETGEDGSILHSPKTNHRVARHYIPQFADASSWDVYEIESNLGRVTQLAVLESASKATIGDVVEIGNGLVTGKDKAFRIDDTSNLNDEERAHLMEIMKAKQLQKYTHGDFTHYIWLNDAGIGSEDELLERFPNFHEQLSSYCRGGSALSGNQKSLEDRYAYNREIKWWEWVFLRNKHWIEKYNEKIMCPCKERYDNKGFVRFSLVRGNAMPLQDVTTLVPFEETRETIEYITAWLNSDAVYRWLVAKGHSRGGVLEFSERPLMRIPFKRIDFDNPDEVEIHDKITDKVRGATTGEGRLDEKALKTELEELIETLIEEVTHDS